MFRAFLFFAYLLIPRLAFAVETEVGDVQTFGDLISQIWAWATQIIFGVSVIMLIIGGVLYMAARGEEERLDTAKQVITGALVSTVLMLFSGILFTFLHKPTAGLAGTAKLTDASNVLSNIANILLGLVGGFSALLLMYNGAQYMLAAGDTEKVNTAKRGLFYSVIGLIISLSAYFLVHWVIGIWVK